MKLPTVITELIYERRINLRGIIDKWAANKKSSDVAHNDDSEHGDFVYIMWTAAILLSFAEFIVLDLPFQILNISSEDANLSFIAWVTIPLDIAIILMLLWMRSCCNAKAMRCSNDLDYYPEKSLKFMMPIAGRLAVLTLPAVNNLLTCVLARFASAESIFAVWLVALNFYKGLSLFFTVCDLNILGCSKYI